MSEGQDSATELVERELAVVELLYGERDEGSVELSEDEAAELAELQGLRSLFGQLEDEDPPARLTAQLMAAATTEHAAARRASAAHEGGRESEQGGFWRWLMRPFLANPAFTAAASLVVLVGVAGALYVVGGLEKQEQAAEPTLAPPADTVAVEGGDEVSAGGAPEQADRAARDQDEGELNLDRLADGYGDTGGAPEKAPSEVAKQPASKGGKLARDKEESAAPSSRTERGARASRSRGPAQGRKNEMDAKRAARAESPAGDFEVDGAEGEGEAPHAAQQSPTERAAKLHADARRRADAGQCAKALKLAAEIRELSRGYYDAKVARDSRLRECRRSREPQAVGE